MCGSLVSCQARFAVAFRATRLTLRLHQSPALSLSLSMMMMMMMMMTSPNSCDFGNILSLSLERASLARGRSRPTIWRRGGGFVPRKTLRVRTLATSKRARRIRERVVCRSGARIPEFERAAPGRDGTDSRVSTFSTRVSKVESFQSPIFGNDRECSERADRARRV